MENPLKNNPVGTKKCMERPGRDSMLYAWNNGKKEPVPEFEGQAKLDHTNVEVGDAWKGHGRVVVKPAEVWVGSGGKQTGRDSMQKTGRLCTEVQANRPVLHDRYGTNRRKQHPVGMYKWVHRSVYIYMQTRPELHMNVTTMVHTDRVCNRTKLVVQAYHTCVEFPGAFSENASVRERDGWYMYISGWFDCDTRWGGRTWEKWEATMIPVGVQF